MTYCIYNRNNYFLKDLKLLFRLKSFNPKNKILFGYQWFCLPIKFLPFQQLQALWTLFSESFSSFPHGTCSLSVSHSSLFSLRWSIPPIKWYSLSCTLKQLDSFTRKHGLTRVWPQCFAIPAISIFAYGSVTLYSSFFQTLHTRMCIKIPQSN